MSHLPMIRWLNLLGWLVCIVYATIPSFWLLIHPWAAHWRKQQRSPYLVLLPLWFAMWIVLGLITWSWREHVLYSAPRTWLPALLLFATGLYLYSQSGHEFSAKQLGGLPELRPQGNEQQLVTAGIRARVRHPVYLAHLCEMSAWSIGTGSAICYSLTAFAIVTGVLMIRLEDTELEHRFGEEYAAYRKRVPALLPRIRG